MISADTAKRVASEALRARRAVKLATDPILAACAPSIPCGNAGAFSYPACGTLTYAGDGSPYCRECGWTLPTPAGEEVPS